MTDKNINPNKPSHGHGCTTACQACGERFWKLDKCRYTPEGKHVCRFCHEHPEAAG